MAGWKETKIGTLPSNWNTKTFEEIIESGSLSYGVVQPGTHRESNSVPILRVNNIRNGKIFPDDVMKIDKEIEAKYKRTRLKGGEFLLTVVGSVGETVIVSDKFKDWNVARAVSVSRISNEYDKNFIKYCFSTEQIKYQMYSHTNDTVQPTLNLSSLKEIILPIPPLAEQQAIAEVLSSLDDKIDLLHRQNKTLEAMAETLFRQWFVEEAEESWEIGKLGDFVTTTSGGTPSRSNPEFYIEGNIDWVKSKELSGSFIFDTEEQITEKAVKKSSAKILPANSILIAMYGATVGEYAILSNSATCNQAICALIPNEHYPYTFLFLFTKANKENLINLAGGSAQQNISQILIKQLEIPTPNGKIIAFHNHVKFYFEKIKANHQQINSLIKLRDELLPKLMSGDDVRVKL